MSAHPRQGAWAKVWSMETTNVQRGKLMSFIRVIYRNIGEELLVRADMDQRQMHYQSPPLYDSLCKLKPAAYCTTCRSPNKYRVFFPAASVSASLFQESLLVFVSCRLFGWSRLVWECTVFTYSWGGRVRVNPVSFGDFLKLLRLGSFPWVFNGPPYGSPSDNEQKSKLGTPQESLKLGFCFPGTPMVNLNSLDQRKAPTLLTVTSNPLALSHFVFSASLEAALTVWSPITVSFYPQSGSVWWFHCALLTLRTDCGFTFLQTSCLKKFHPRWKEAVAQYN